MASTNNVNLTPKKKKHSGCLIVFIVVIGLFFAIGSLGSDATPAADNSTAPDSANVAIDTSDTDKDTPSKGDEDAAQSADPETEDNSTMTTSAKNALRAAKRYLQTMPFSHDGLIEQLEFEKYSTEDATIAADNCNADWNEQALKKAKDYLSLKSFSHDHLIEQLEFEKYTSEQASYAADNCGADWNEQAVGSAKNYLELMPFSRDQLIEQLEFEGFTHDQAVYGVTQNGL